MQCGYAGCKDEGHSVSLSEYIPGSKVIITTCDKHKADGIAFAVYFINLLANSIANGLSMEEME